MSESPTSVVFLHPDLGIGGAERAMIDAALALKDSGYAVQFLTSHHDPAHCFEETKNGELTVQVAGDWLPRGLLGRGKALFAYFRMLYATLCLLLCPSLRRCDIVMVDQISLPVPVLRFFGYKVLFYCHFPDLLLTDRKSLMKRLYRYPLDWLEEVTTGWAHQVLVNSNFTAEVFQSTFLSLNELATRVLYPVPSLDALDVEPPAETLDNMPPALTRARCLFISLNRYERKKNVALAIEAFKQVLIDVPEASEHDTAHLVIAGGYDDQLAENVEHFRELNELVDLLEIRERVTFLRSCSTPVKLALLSRASALLYTPDREHFGIVPVEAMYLRCPVVAVNSGGPKETVAHGQTGFLCEQTPAKFAEKMSRFIKESDLSGRLGEAGRTRVISRFGFAAFKSQLNTIFNELRNL